MISAGAPTTSYRLRATLQLPLLVTRPRCLPGRDRLFRSTLGHDDLAGLDWGPDDGPNLIVNHGPDATLLIHEGLKAGEIFEKTGQMLDPASTDNVEFPIVWTIIGDGLETDLTKCRRMNERLVSLWEEMTTVFKSIYQMQANGTLLFLTIKINDFVTKSKLPLPNWLMRATSVMVVGKVLARYGDVGKGCATALKHDGARVFVTKVDPIYALQALMEGLHVLKKSGHT